jgi:hypothetical protein
VETQQGMYQVEHVSCPGGVAAVAAVLPELGSLPPTRRSNSNGG